MDFKELRIRGISHSQSKAGAYALILEEPLSGIKLPIVIGGNEAQAISIGLEKDLPTARPLTHDIFIKFITETGYEVVSVIIHNIVDGVFYSNINFTNKSTGDAIVLDARTSDAVAMAVRQDAPIYTTSEVLSEAGIILEIQEIPSSHQDQEEISQEREERLEHLPSDVLRAKLEEAVKIEDFDTAAKIQEILNHRAKPID
ncbi:bifunctional nuclease family protein [Bergeyella zoohelcum]|uniref:Uncharacterized ACR, COG1259 n=1 Tax=Bergeyella zoohelcum TaxID=1015 RepID=A0A380ZT55_9FLAO|nr:bifunctional nuclease family protein [Bergeyella zoohelcum]EKB59138.1 hypothetical protein HMPREF9700_01615 [Bergeyella zoohelcum CCUG 30536]SUV52501.1 Uncharacterised ACR, COG1259 [Bergeyella zoohelcum]